MSVFEKDNKCLDGRKRTLDKQMLSFLTKDHRWHGEPSRRLRSSVVYFATILPNIDRTIHLTARTVILYEESCLNTILSAFFFVSIHSQSSCLIYNKKVVPTKTTSHAKNTYENFVSYSLQRFFMHRVQICDVNVR